MITIGADLSVNSTGICVNRDGVFDYYIIASKLTKKQQAFVHPNVHIIHYQKDQPDGEYHVKEAIKTTNINRIINAIDYIVRKNHPDVVNIEGVSFGSVGSAALIDLTGLNYMLRKHLLDLNIPFNIISPTQNKKFATGNGSADKNMMVDAWKRLDSNIKGINEIKIDDLADAYFLSRFEFSE